MNVKFLIAIGLLYPHSCRPQTIKASSQIVVVISLATKSHVRYPNLLTSSPMSAQLFPEPNVRLLILFCAHHHFKQHRVYSTATADVNNSNGICIKTTQTNWFICIFIYICIHSHLLDLVLLNQC